MRATKPRPFHNFWTLSVALAACLTVLGCGGGGGAPPATNIGQAPANPSPSPNPTPVDPIRPAPPPGTAPASYTINGAVLVLETAAVDSDTNSPDAQYVPNDSFASAQTLTSPMVLTGP